MRKLLLKILFKNYFSKIDDDTIIFSQKDLINHNESICYEKKSELSFDYKNYDIYPSEIILDWKLQLSHEHDFQGAYYLCLDNAELIGKNGTVIYKNQIVIDSILNSKGYLKKHGEHKLVNFRHFFKTDESFEYGISLVNCLNHSFFHWVIEAMPLIQALFHFEERNQNISGIKIFVSNESPCFVFQYLSLLGFDEARIIKLKGNKIKVKNLIQPTVRYYRLTSHNGDWAQHLFPKSLFSFLRDRLINESSVSDLPKKIYVSRADVKQRGVQNEEQLVSLLESKGYKKVVLSDYSIVDQITLFNHATHLITPHGAALTNSLFSDNLKIVELYPDKRKISFAYYFYQISSYFGHSHKLMICKSDDKQNIEVDLEQLQQILD